MNLPEGYEPTDTVTQYRGGYPLFHRLGGMSDQAIPSEDPHSGHLPECWTQDMGGMKRASAESCAVCEAIKSAVADALHEYDKQTYERCAQHMRTARREALDAAREAVPHQSTCWDGTDEVCDCFRAFVVADIDALREANH